MRQNFFKIVNLLTIPYVLWLLLLFLMPAPSIVGYNMRLTFFTIAALGFFRIWINKEKKISKGLFEIIVLIVLFAGILSLSLLFNLEFVTSRDIAEILRIIIYMEMLILGYFYSANVRAEQLVILFYFLITLQLIFVGAEYFNIDTLIEIKQHIFRSRLMPRATGTYPNPNRLSFYFIIFILGVWIFKYNRIPYKKILFYTLSGLLALLIFASGSRTGLVVFVALLVMGLMSSKIFVRVGFYLFFLFLIVGLIIFTIQYQYIYNIIFEPTRDLTVSDLGYLGESIRIFTPEGIDLSEIGSFSSRLSLWENQWDFFTTLGDHVWLVGASPRKDNGLQIVDNDYLHHLFRYGIIGFMVYYSIWIKVFLDVVRYPHLKVANFIKYAILTYAVAGLTSETFSSWSLIPSLMFFIGIFYGQILSNKNESKKIAISKI